MTNQSQRQLLFSGSTLVTAPVKVPLVRKVYKVQVSRSSNRHSNYETVLETESWKQAAQEYRKLKLHRDSKRHRVIVETFIDKPVKVKVEVFR